MKKVFIAIAVLIIASCNPKDQNPDFHKYTGEEFQQMDFLLKHSIGSEGNPYSRVDFDILRFRDPATGNIPANIRSREIAFAKTLPVSRGFSVKSGNRSRNIQADFSSAGPDNVGGRSRAIAIDITNENVLFAGGVSGGLWRSVNQGNTWTRVSEIDALPNIRYIHQDIRAGHTNEWYYSTGEILPGSSAGSVGAPYRGNGIYKSNDGGITWSQIAGTATGPIEDATSPFNYVHRIAQDFSNTAETEIYAAAIGGIYRSTNGFNSSQLVVGHDNITTNNDGIWTEVAVTSTGVVYATISNFLGQNGPETGIFRSETGLPGSFEEITPTGFFSTYRRIVIGIDPSNEDVVYFLANNNTSNQFYRYDASQPEGSEWTDLTSSIPMFGGSVGNYEAQGSYNMLVKVHPENSDVVFIGGTNLYRSTNAFSDDSETDWVGGYSRANNSQDYFGSHADMHSLIFFPSDGNKSLNGHDGGISITDNNLKNTITEVTDSENNVVQEVMIEWELLNNGYRTSQFYSLATAVQNAGHPTLMGGKEGNSTYIIQDDDRATPWINIGTGDGGFCYYDLESVIISAQLANVFRFDNSGGSFENISPPNVGDDDAFLFISPIAADPVSPSKVFIGSEGKIYYTLDIGTNPRGDEWFSFGSSAIPSDERVSAISGSVNPQSVLYVGTEDGTLLRINNSTALDGITDITGNQFPNNAYISSIAVDPRDADHVLVAFSNYNVTNLFSTSDGGQSWTAVQGNLQASPSESGGSPSTRWVTIVPNGETETIYLLGTSVGLFSTTNLQGGSTQWAREAINTIGTSPIDMITYRPLDGYVAVATHGNGIYEANLGLPMRARLQLLDVRCTEGTFSLRTSIAFSGQSDFDLEYEWFVNGVSQGSELNSSGITADFEGRFQVLVTNNVTGQSHLSNEVTVDFNEANSLWCSGNPIASIEDELKEGLLLYPNPVADQLTVQHDLRGEVQVELYSINGTKHYATTSRDSQITISMDGLTPGTYLVVVFNEQKKISKRVVKI